MFKYSATIFLLVTLLAQTFQRAVIVGGYYTNTEAYAKNCINKASPQLHCNGKCQLMKKLKQEEKKDRQIPERRSNNKEEVLSSKSFFAVITDSRLLSPAFYTPGKSGQPVDRAEAFFHPPGA